jgi:transposase/FtsZ-binding cell division protein ZapB
MIMSGYGFKNTKDRHRAYLDLWDAFQEHGCPVCALVERQCRNDIDEIINEATDNLEEDMAHRDPMFICNWHIREIWAVGSSAIRHRIMEDALRIEEGDLKEILLKYKQSSTKLIILQKLRWEKPPSYYLLKQMKKCHLCRNMVHIEEYYLQAFLSHMADFDFSMKFKRSAGICFHHFFKAAEMFPYHRNLLVLVKAQIERIQILRWELSETKRYNSRQADESNEIDFPQRVLNIIAGERGDFPNQIEQKKRCNGKMDDHLSSLSFIDESTVEADHEDSQVEKLKFENEKLRRQYKELRNDYMNESARAASLHYRNWSSYEENKILKRGLVGARARISAYAEHVGRLNMEIEKLQERLKNRETKKCN